MISSKYSHRSRVSYPKVCKPPPPPPPLIPAPPAMCACEFDAVIDVDAGEEAAFDFTPHRGDLPEADPIAAAWAAEPTGWLDGPATVYNLEHDEGTYYAPDEGGDYWYKMTLTWSDAKQCVHAGVAHVTD